MSRSARIGSDCVRQLVNGKWSIVNRKTFVYSPFTIHYSPFAVLACDCRSSFMVAKPKSERREHFKTSSGIELPVDFNPSNTEAIDYDRDLGDPGEFPFTRGIRPNMYRGRLWTMRQYA